MPGTTSLEDGHNLPTEVNTKRTRGGRGWGAGVAGVSIARLVREGLPVPLVLLFRALALLTVGGQSLREGRRRRWCHLRRNREVTTMVVGRTRVSR